MGKIKVPYNFPVPPLNKGTLNSLKKTEPSSEHSTEQGTFGGSLNCATDLNCTFVYFSPLTRTPSKHFEQKVVEWSGSDVLNNQTGKLSPFDWMGFIQVYLVNA